MSDLLIRRLRPDDAEPYRGLMLAAYAREPAAFTASVAERGGLPLSWWAARLGGEAAAEQVWGAWLAGELVGAVGLARETRPGTAHRATLFGMVVAPAARRRGTGRALVQALQQAVRDDGAIAQVGLTVSEGNAAALSLYEAMGFVRWGREPDAVRQEDGPPIAKWHLAWAVPALPLRLHWADSEVASLTRQPAGVCLRLAAASVDRWHDGRWEPGHLGPVLVWLTMDGLPEWSAGRLRSGHLLGADGQRLSHLPLPSDQAGPAVLSLDAARGDSAQWAVQGLRLQPAPGATWRPSLAC